MAQAQNGQAPPGPPEDSHGRGGLFMRADANNDGVVTRQEWDAFRAAEFARLDANRDGELSRDEMRAGRHWGGRGGGGPDGGRRFDFARIDANHDGVISQQELQNAQQAIAERRANRPDPDTNGDGMISRAEWDAMGAARFQRMDANNDGRVTRDEAEAARPRRSE